MANSEVAATDLTTFNQYEAAGQLEVSPTRIGPLIAGLITGQGLPTGVYDTDGAIALKSGLGIIKKASANALTLAAPVATTDDGKVLSIVSTTAFAHTVTFPSGKINGGSLTTATFGAAVGNAMRIVAYQGVWYTMDVKGVTVS